MKKKLDLSFIGSVSFDAYGICFRTSDGRFLGLERCVYDALADNGSPDGEKEKYYGRINITVHAELLDDQGLKVEVE